VNVTQSRWKRSLEKRMDLGLRIEVAVTIKSCAVSEPKVTLQHFPNARLVTYAKCRAVVTTLEKSMAEYFGMFELGSANMGRKRVDVVVGTIGQGD
jgi:hypothetical protein